MPTKVTNCAQPRLRGGECRRTPVGGKPEVVPRVSLSCLVEAGASRHKGLKVGKMLVDSTSDFL